jgi:hypothetical protein
MSESYLIPRAEEFSKEAALSLVLNSRLELLLAQHGSEDPDVEGKLLEDIPITNVWSLDVLSKSASIYDNTDICNRQGEPLKDVVVLTFWWVNRDETIEDYDYDYDCYTIGGYTKPILVGSNGAYDMVDDHYLDSTELEALFMDVQTLVVPHLEGRDRATEDFGA